MTHSGSQRAALNHMRKYIPRLVIENAKRKKNVWLAPTMNLSSMTAPDYWKVCPNFWLGEIQFNQSQAWTWSHLGISHCLWSNERPGICYLLIFPEPEVRIHLPIIRGCHGAQIHWWCQLDIFFSWNFQWQGVSVSHKGNSKCIICPYTRAPL